MPANWTTVFTDIGSAIRLHNKFGIDLILNVLDAEMSTIMTNFNSNQTERELAQDFLTDVDGFKAGASSWQNTLKTRCDAMISKIVKEEINSGQTGVTGILDEAIDAFQDDAQSIDGNYNESYAKTGDSDGELTLWTLTGLTRRYTTDGYIYAKLTKPGQYLLEIFADSGKTYTIGIASAPSTTATATLTVAAINGSIGGTVLMTYTDGEASVTLRMLGIEDIDNTGTQNAGLIATSQMTKDEVWTLECTRAKAGTTPSQWKAAGTVRGSTSSLAAAAAYTPTNLEFTLTLNDHSTAITDFNDGANQLSDWSLSGLTRANCNRAAYSAGDYYSKMGLLYAKLYEAGGNTVLELYKDVALGASDMVAQGSMTGTATGTLTMTATNSSGLTGTVTVDYSVNDSDIVLVCEIPWAVGDRLQFTLVSDDAGTIQSYFRDQYRKTWESVTDGTETIPDSLAE